MIRYRARIWWQDAVGRERTSESGIQQSWEFAAQEAIQRATDGNELKEDVIAVAVITINKLRDK